MILNSIRFSISLVFSLLVNISAHGQENKIRIEAGLAMFTGADSDIEYVYGASATSPIFQVNLGYEVFNSSWYHFTAKTGVSLGTTRFIRPSTFEFWNIDFPEKDNLFAFKSRTYAYLNLGAEIRRYFDIPLKGLFVYTEPQLQILLSAKERLLERLDNVETRNEKYNLNNYFNPVVFASKFGVGYDFTLPTKFKIYLIYECNFYSFNGHIKSSDVFRLGRGLKLGVLF